MSAADRIEASRSRRTRGTRSSTAVGAEVPRSVEDILHTARGVQRRVQRELRDRPEAVLAAVAAAAFVAGAAVGSRFGRIVLSALVPFGVQHFLATSVGPRVAAYVTSLSEDHGEGSNGTSPKAQPS
jgi:hypothetical protein